MRSNGDSRKSCTSAAGLKLIVNADDFGLSKSVNRAIADAHENGIVTAASLMPNAQETNDAIEIAKSMPSLDMGIHLTLVEETPILPAGEVSSLITEDGKFHPNANSIASRYFQGKIDLLEVRKELTEQIQKVVESGISVSHLDSHQHLHMLPKIFVIVRDLARKFGVPAIRLPRESIRLYMLRRIGGVVRVSQALVLNMLSRSCDLQTLKSTDHFAGFYFGGNLNRRNLEIIVSSLPAYGFCELMCHPSLKSEGSHHAAWEYHGQAEHDALTSEEIREMIRSRGIKMSTFKDLKNYVR